MAKNVIELLVSITGDDDLSDALKKAGASLNDFSKQVSDMAKKGALAFGALGAAIAGGLGLAAKGAADFKNDMAGVFALLDKETRTPAMVKGLTDGAREIRTEFGLMGSDVAEAMRVAIGSGIEASKAVDFLTASSKAAVSGMVPLKDVVQVTASVVAGYGLEAKDAAKVQDSLAKAVNLGTVEWAHFAQGLGQVVPFAKMSGLSVDELAGTVATLTLKGFPAEQAMTSLKAALAGLQNPMKAQVEAWDALGISLKDATGKTRPFLTLLGEVRAKIASGADVDVAMLFGDINAKAAAVSLLDGNMQLLNRTLGEMKGSAGAVNEQFAGFTADNPLLLFQRLTEQVKVLVELVGDQVLSTFGGLAAQLAGVVTQVIAWMQANPGLTKMLVAVAAAVGALSLALAGILAGVFVFASALTAAASVALAPLLVLVGAVVVGLGVLATAFAGIQAGLEPLKEFVGRWLPTVRDALTRFGLEIGTALAGGWAKVKTAMASVVPLFLGLAERVVPFALNAFRRFGAFVSQEAIPWVVKAITWLVENAGTLFQVLTENWPKIEKMLRAGFDAVVAAVGVLWQVLKSVWTILSAIWNAGGGWQGFSRALEVTVGVVGGLATGLKYSLDFLTAMVDTAGELLAKLGAVGAKLRDGTLGVLSSAASKVGSIMPSFAEGGVFAGSGGLALLHGPEAIVPLSGGAIPVQMLGGGSTTNGPVTITINAAPGMSAHQIAQQVAEVIARRRGG